MPHLFVGNYNLLDILFFLHLKTSLEHIFGEANINIELILKHYDVV